MQQEESAKPRIPPLHKLREIAVAASCDPRTVARVLEGKSVRAMVRERVEAALEKLGMQTPEARG